MSAGPAFPRGPRRSAQAEPRTRSAARRASGRNGQRRGLRGRRAVQGGLGSIEMRCLVLKASKLLQ